MLRNMINTDQNESFVRRQTGSVTKYIYLWTKCIYLCFWTGISSSNWNKTVVQTL